MSLAGGTAIDTARFGWRFWNVRQGRLKSPYQDAIALNDRFLDATCPDHGYDEIPAHDCRCGVYFVPQYDHIDTVMRVGFPFGVRLAPAFTFGVALGPLAQDSSHAESRRGRRYHVLAIVLHDLLAPVADEMRAHYRLAVVVGITKPTCTRIETAVKDSSDGGPTILDAMANLKASATTGVPR